MSRLARNILVLASLLLIAEACVASDKRTPEEKDLDAQRAETKGIVVGQPKVYDDSVLQQMLNNAAARLASLQILDQSGIASKLGSITGAAQTINSLGISIQGPPVPQVVTTANGPTNSTVTGAQTSSTQGMSATGPTSSVTNSTSAQNTANAPVTNTTATNPQLNVPTVSAPTPTTTLPSSFSVSASDILNEQIQLTYEIANLRLLLEGSLNDRLVEWDGHKAVKPRVTIGFPITLLPDDRHKQAIAVVEVEIEKIKCETEPCDDLKKNEQPALVALLPREKTYNVAAITESNVSIGAGVVTQVLGFSASFLHGRKTYYVVQDQDTVALTFQPKDPKRIGFLWEFRPVLGSKVLREGLKQTFVQIAFPSNMTAPKFGSIHVKTYWREYDARTNLVKQIRAGSLTATRDWPIDNIPLGQKPKVFDVTSLEDLGNGQMLVKVQGRFLAGTYVRVGQNLFKDGNPGFTFDYQQIRFVAPIADLATKQTYLVARDGTEIQLTLANQKLPAKPLKIANHALHTVDDANTRLSVELEEIATIHQQLPLVLVIGGKVFGYSDAPLVREDKVLSAVVPTAFLAANPLISVRSVLTDDRYWHDAQLVLPEFAGGGSVPKLAVLATASNSATFLLYGGDIQGDWKVISPQGARLDRFGADRQSELHTITLDKNQLKNQKQIALEGPKGFSVQIPVPSIDLPDSAKPSITPLRAVTVASDEAVFKGQGLNDVQKVVFNGIELKLRKQADGKAICLKGLKAAGVTAEAKQQSLDFYFNSGKQNVSFAVVATSP